MDDAFRSPLRVLIDELKHVVAGARRDNAELEAEIARLRETRQAPIVARLELAERLLAIARSESHDPGAVRDRAVAERSQGIDLDGAEDAATDDSEAPYEMPATPEAVDEVPACERSTGPEAASGVEAPRWSAVIRVLNPDRITANDVCRVAGEIDLEMAPIQAQRKLVKWANVGVLRRIDRGVYQVTPKGVMRYELPAHESGDQSEDRQEASE